MTVAASARVLIECAKFPSPMTLFRQRWAVPDDCRPRESRGAAPFVMNWSGRGAEEEKDGDERLLTQEPRLGFGRFYL